MSASTVGRDTIATDAIRVSSGVALVAVRAGKSGTGCCALSASRSGLAPSPVGAAYATVTVSRRCTASARASVTVLPLTATGSAAARLSVLSVPARVRFTVNALAGGTDVASSAPSNVMVSVERLTDAWENAGGVTLVAVLLLNSGARLPDRSLTGFVEPSWGR